MFCFLIWVVLHTGPVSCMNVILQDKVYLK